MLGVEGVPHALHVFLQAAEIMVFEHWDCIKEHELLMSLQSEDVDAVEVPKV
jgi:hypothetical protein